MNETRDLWKDLVCQTKYACHSSQTQHSAKYPQAVHSQYTLSCSPELLYQPQPALQSCVQEQASARVLPPISTIFLSDMENSEQQQYQTTVQDQQKFYKSQPSYKEQTSHHSYKPQTQLYPFKTNNVVISLRIPPHNHNRDRSWSRATSCQSKKPQNPPLAPGQLSPIGALCSSNVDSVLNSQEEDNSWRFVSMEAGVGSKQNKSCGRMTIKGEPCKRLYPCPFHASNSSQATFVKQHWKLEEHLRFLKGLQYYGPREWAEISRVVGNKTMWETKKHAQRYFLRQKQVVKSKSSIHDYSMETLEQLLKNSGERHKTELELQMNEEEEDSEGDDMKIRPNFRDHHHSKQNIKKQEGV